MNPFATLVAQVTKQKTKRAPRLSFEIVTIYRPRAQTARCLQALVEAGRPLSATELSDRCAIQRNRIRSALRFCERVGIVRRDLIQGRSIYTLIKKS